MISLKSIYPAGQVFWLYRKKSVDKPGNSKGVYLRPVKLLMRSLIPIKLPIIILSFLIAIILGITLPAVIERPPDVPSLPTIIASTPTPTPTPPPIPTLVPRQAGLALTFDDMYVDDWYGLRGLFNEYGVKATFFICNPDKLTTDQVNKLKVLQSDGNEIACHGWRHIDAAEYTAAHSIDDYINIEIVPAISLMKSWGMGPLSFAYPYDSSNAQLDSALFDYFGHLRTLTWPHGDVQLRDLDAAFYKYDDNRVIGGVVMDNIFNYPLSLFYSGIDRAKENDEVLVLVGHQTKESTYPDYITPPSKLRAIIEYARQNNLQFYTMSELLPGEQYGLSHTDLLSVKPSKSDP